MVYFLMSQPAIVLQHIVILRIQNLRKLLRNGLKKVVIVISSLSPQSKLLDLYQYLCQ